MILWPHGGGVGQEPPTTGTPVPFQKSAEFQALGYPGFDRRTRAAASGQSGLQKLYEFVQAGGTLITEGGTSAIFPTNYLTPGITIDQGDGPDRAGLGLSRHRRRSRRARSSTASPRNHLPVYYKTNGGPLFSVGGQPGPLAAAPAADRARRRTRRRQLPEHAADGREPRTCSARGIRRRTGPASCRRRLTPTRRGAGGGAARRWRGRRWRTAAARRRRRSSAVAAAAARRRS